MEINGIRSAAKELGIPVLEAAARLALVEAPKALLAEMSKVDFDASLTPIFVSIEEADSTESGYLIRVDAAEGQDENDAIAIADHAAWLVSSWVFDDGLLEGAEEKTSR